MSTDIELLGYFDCGTVEAAELLQSAAAEFYRVARTYTRFSDDSQLSQVNRAGSGKLTTEFAILVRLILELAEFSGGAFDPTIIDLMEINGYKSSFDAQKIIQNRKVPVDIARYLAGRPSWRQIELDESPETTIRLAPGQRLDLGSVGKGYAIACAAGILAAGSKRFLINAGGDIYGLGPGWSADLEIKAEQKARGEPKRNVIGSPGRNVGEKTGESASRRVLGKAFTTRYLKLDIAANGQAIAASGSWARRAGDFHHLLDPASGQPTQQNHPSQAFCIGPDPALADGLATVLCLTGKHFIDPIKERYGYDSLVVEHGKLYYSDGVAIKN